MWTFAAATVRDDDEMTREKASAQLNQAQESLGQLEWEDTSATQRDA